MSGAALERARARVREAGGDALLERLEHLDAAIATRSAAPAPPPPAPDRGAAADVDVAIAGGGLSLLIAPVLAAAGLRVAVFERARAGAAHREWNASGPELAPLVDSGVLDRARLESLVLARYREGVCRWHGGGAYPVRGVLDHAVDAHGLLATVRARAESLGVAFHDGTAVLGHAAGPDAVAVRIAARDGGAETVTARVLVDARGAASPHATADLVCPTVGGTLAGLVEGDAPNEVDPGVGDILVTVDDVEDGRQHIWEGFPGRPGETTVYLFHYAPRGALGPSPLLELYARFFDRLPGYKRGEARLLRPTFGFIPGWSRLAPAPRSGAPRIVLVGDAAARHSPLTFCGFGATLRSFQPAAAAIAAIVADGPAAAPPDGRIVHDAPVHSGTGALARLMASPPRDPARARDLNALLDAAFATLHAMGDAAYARLLRDEMGLPEFVEFLRRTAARRPRVYREALEGLGAAGLARWGAAIALGLTRARRP